MKLETARQHVGAGVVYTPEYGGRREYGFITSVNEHYVFVHYSGDNHSKATDAYLLEFATPLAVPNTVGAQLNTEITHQ